MLLSFRLPLVVAVMDSSHMQARDYERALARRARARRARGILLGYFQSLTLGTPPILPPRVLGRQPGLWVPHLLPLHFGAFEGVSTMKNSLKARPWIPTVASKKWKSRAPRTKLRTVRILARVHRQHGRDEMRRQTTQSGSALIPTSATRCVITCNTSKSSWSRCLVTVKSPRPALHRNMSKSGKKGR